MPRVQLWADFDPKQVSIPFVNPDGTLSELTNHRLYCKVFAGRDLKDHDAIVDTGATSMIFPHSVWQRFAGQITPVAFADGQSTRGGVIGGKSFRFKLGRITVQLAGRSEGQRLPAVEVVAQFEQLDPAINPADRLKITYVGLQFGPLENRYLVVSPKQTHVERCEVWISDERPVDPLVLASVTL